MKLKVSELTKESFAPYGRYFNINDFAKGEKLTTCPYFPDVSGILFENSNYAGVGIGIAIDRPRITTETEIHEHTEEMLGFLDAESIFIVGEPSGKTPDLSNFKAFLVPKGTYFTMKRGTWHSTPFPTDSDKITLFVILPPYTNLNDCITCKIDPIELEN